MLSIIGLVQVQDVSSGASDATPTACYPVERTVGRDATLAAVVDAHGSYEVALRAVQAGHAQGVRRVK